MISKPPIPRLNSGYRRDWPARLGKWGWRNAWWILPLCFAAGWIWSWADQAIRHYLFT